MVKEFMVLMGLVVILVGAMLTHYSISRDSQVYDKLSALTALTKIGSPSISSAYYEPRLLNESSSHSAYPQMPSIDRTDFVYAR